MKRFDKKVMTIRVTPETRKILEDERLSSGMSLGQVVDVWAKIVTQPKALNLIVAESKKGGI